MNNPNPFIPQGSLQDQRNKKRARFKLAVYISLGATILVVSPMLILGCKKEAPVDASNNVTPPDTNNVAPPIDTNTNTMPPLANNLTNAAPMTNAAPPPPPPPPPPTTQEYVVAHGDTFSSIAKKFSVKIKEIEAANPGITPTKLKVGQKLTIPASGSSSTMGTEPNGGGSTTEGEVYAVKSGDTLTKIAHEHGVSVKALRAANELKTDKIKVGEKLKIPEKAGSAESNPTPPPPGPAPEPAPAAMPEPSTNGPAH